MAYGGVNTYLYSFLASALDGGQWTASHPCCSNHGGKTPGTHLTGGWVDTKVGMDVLCKEE
jgi:hypothetical protein